MNKKTVLVTGASRGIGKAIAIKFAKKNYNVVINCINSEEKLLATKKEIESYNVTCMTFVGDIGIYDNAVKLFEQIKKHFGKVDVLVNISGNFIDLIVYPPKHLTGIVAPSKYQLKYNHPYHHLMMNY